MAQDNRDPEKNLSSSSSTGSTVSSFAATPSQCLAKRGSSWVTVGGLTVGSGCQPANPPGRAVTCQWASAVVARQPQWRVEETTTYGTATVTGVTSLITVTGFDHKLKPRPGHWHGSSSDPSTDQGSATLRTGNLQAAQRFLGLGFGFNGCVSTVASAPSRTRRH
eukprot:3872204-Rhodomonas_salina.1